MNMAQVSVKVYYVENKATKEIRKFVVDGELAENFEYLVGKIRNVFPDLLRKDLEVFWKDDEDDYISISSNEELSQAISNVPVDAACLKIFVKAKQEKQESQSVEHPGVTCDGCNTVINGIRYKCTNCYDFDLCSSCETKDLHPLDHEMLCIKKPRTSASIYVMRPPFGRGCHRGKGPFGGRSKGPFGRCKPWGHCGPHGMQRGNCSRKQENCCREDNSQQNKEVEQQNQKMLEMIRSIANGFGFDPDVAESHLELFMGKFANNFQEDQQQQKKENAEQSSSEHEGGDSTTPPKGADEEVIVGSISSNAPNPTEQKMEMETEGENSASTSKNADSVPPNVDQMMNEFAKQLGFDPAQPGENNPFANLGDVVGKVFESLSTSAQNQKINDESQGQENHRTQKEDFIVVDSNPADTEKLTEEQKYELRLEKAIKQMESMGFDNEGGWLRQLLISKDLSIGKVLDALNPAN